MKEAEHWSTAITDIQPNKIIVRGYPLAELMTSANFAQAVFLLWTGELPTREHEEIFNMILIAGVDHGGSPPSTLTARTVTSTGAPLNGALAAGLLSINKHHGGAVEDCMLILNELVQRDGSLEENALSIVREYRNMKRNLPGLGHRVHTDDPRVKVLFDKAQSVGIMGEYVNALLTLQKAFYEETGKMLPINVDGGMAALLAEMGFKPIYANAIFMLSRVPGLIAHIVEEKEREKPMRRIHPTGYLYDGKSVRSIVVHPADHS